MSRHLSIDDLHGLSIPGDPAISPDGGRIAYVLRTTDGDRDRDDRALWTVSAAGGAATPLTDGPDDGSPAWSPDGTAIAFLRGAPAQVWTMPAAGGEPVPMTDLPLGAGPPSWSRDGTRIAFTAPVEPARPLDEADPVVIDRLGYKADGSGRARGRRRHLHVLTVATGQVRRVTAGDWDAREPAWSPDGDRLAFAASTSPDADLRMESAAYVVDLREDHPEPTLVGEPHGICETVTWSPEGDALLVVGRPTVSLGNMELAMASLADGSTARIAADLDRNVMRGEPAYPGGRPVVTGRGVVFCARNEGCTHLYRFDPGLGRTVSLVAEPGRVVAGLSASDGDRLAVTLVTDQSYGEVAIVDAGSGDVRVLTAHTTESLPDVAFIRPQARRFTISDGTVVSGWVLRREDAPTPAPVLLDVHGGPHSAWAPVLDGGRGYHQVLAAAGWTVLLLNPRGSDGYGSEFFTATVGGWGSSDENDLLEPLDMLVEEGIADPDRLALTGYSYGGYMTCHLTTRTNRFAVAVAGGVVSDTVSFAGTSDVGHEMALHDLGGLPHTDRAKFGDQSPIERVEYVGTPTLILHGDQDDRCPVGLAEQWFTALRERQVPTRLVLYPGGSHLFFREGRPSHRADFNRRVIDWIRTYTVRPRHRTAMAGHWRQRLMELARRHDVPGATLGILRLRPDGTEDLVEAAHGVLSRETKVPVTTATSFQIGSITKVWTTTLVLQLIDEGKLDLDTPVVEVLPELRLDGTEATKVRIRDLLAHTSGIPGDHFEDTGRGDDCVEKYVASLRGHALQHPPGEIFSYSNGGFVVAGRVIEALTGLSWDEALRERLVRPLGLRRTTTLPEDALLGRAAVGHLPSPDGPRPTPLWGPPRSIGPAGSICATAGDVLEFARMHLAGGRSRGGAQIVSPRAVALMRHRHADVPGSAPFADSWGLGWMRTRWQDRDLIGHDGSTIGQNAFLRILAPEGLAVVLLTNGGRTTRLFQDLFGEIFDDLAGVRPPSLPVPAAGTTGTTRWAGTYERVAERAEITGDGDRMLLRLVTDADLAAAIGMPAVEEHELRPGDAADTFLFWSADQRIWVPVSFVQGSDGRQYLHSGLRASARIRGR